jgi:transposase
MYPQAFKAAVLIAFQKLQNYRSISRLFDVSIGTLFTWLHPKVNVDPRPRVDHVLSEYVRIFLLDKPFSTCTEVSRWIWNKHNIHVSRQRVAKLIAMLRLSRKRSRIRVERSGSVEKAKEFKASFPVGIPPSLLFAVDEMGCSEKTLPLYGYSARGTRLHHKRSSGGWKNVSTLAIVGNTGEIVSQQQQPSYNSVSFAAFMESLELPEGSHIILDNVSFHKSLIVRDVFLRRKWTPLFIPPYQPDFNPIENVFSWIKHNVRKYVYDGMSVVKSVQRSIALPGLSDVIKRCFSRLFHIVSR